MSSNDPSLTEAIAAARARWPAIAFDQAAIARNLANRAAPECTGELPPFAVVLVLAQACLEGDEAALRVFRPATVGCWSRVSDVVIADEHGSFDFETDSHLSRSQIIVYYLETTWKRSLRGGGCGATIHAAISLIPEGKPIVIW